MTEVEAEYAGKGGKRKGAGRKKTGRLKTRVQYSLPADIVDMIEASARKAGEYNSIWLEKFLRGHMQKEDDMADDNAVMDSAQFVADCMAMAKDVSANQLGEILTPEDLIEYAIARAKPKEDGNTSLGTALASSYSDFDPQVEDGKAQIAFSRIARAKDMDSLLAALKKTLPYVAANAKRPISYVRLLDDMRQFARANDAEEMAAIKRRWAMDFYAFS